MARGGATTTSFTRPAADATFSPQRFEREVFVGRWKFVKLAILVLAFSGCVASTNRVDVASDEPFSDTETSSKDLLAVAQNMSRSLIQLPQIYNAKTPPR